MKKELIFKIVITIIVIVLIGIWLRNRFFVSQNEGSIQIKIIDEHQNVISDEEIEFKEGDTLEGILTRNYDCLIEDGMLLNLETLITPTDWSYFIGIYKNGEMSNVGIKEIKFQDGDVIEFIFTDTSTFYG